MTVAAKTKRILILCTGNSCRSQMAEGFLKSFDKNLEVFSAGTKPAEKVNPFAVKAMQEIGIDISNGVSENVDKYLSQSFDYVITVCDNAKETCPVFIGNVKHQIHIGFDDPADAVGSEEEVMPVYRRVRDEIKNDFYEFYLKNLMSKENIIKVYGSGCSNCKKLEQMCIDAAQELNINATVEKVNDLQEIMKTGIMSTPGLEINGKMISSGKLPTKSTLIHWIQENIN
ncbi:MAG: thioredoxin family protein [Ignavibacteriales bacterium]|nr:thioredoxin family protein [Ignavibacteriales bacterium]